MTKAVDLATFVKQMHADIDAFAANWLKGHAKEPEQWPLTNGEGDWYDQFLIFESSGQNEDDGSQAGS